MRNGDTKHKRHKEYEEDGSGEQTEKEEEEVDNKKDEDNVDFGSSGTHEDTAIKIIRVFANVSINPEAGSSLALCENIVDTLLDICQLPIQQHQTSTSLVSGKHRKQLSKYDNILLPTLATLNNLSFYPLVHQKETYKLLKNFLHPPPPPLLSNRSAVGNEEEFSLAGNYSHDETYYFVRPSNNMENI